MRMVSGATLMITTDSPLLVLRDAGPCVIPTLAFYKIQYSVWTPTYPELEGFFHWVLLQPSLLSDKYFIGCGEEYAPVLSAIRAESSNTQNSTPKHLEL